MFMSVKHVIKPRVLSVFALLLLKQTFLCKEKERHLSPAPQAVSTVVSVKFSSCFRHHSHACSPVWIQHVGIMDSDFKPEQTK